MATAREARILAFPQGPVLMVKRNLHTGLPHQQLTEAELIVTANIAARADTNVRPHDWQLLTPADEHPTTHRPALPAIAA